MRTATAIFCATLALSSLASAQAKPDARALSEQAKAAFDRGDFADAAKLLEDAYREKPWPVLLYNLGRAYQQAGNKAQAIDAYERYLAAEPTSNDAGAVRESIRQLKEQIDRDRTLKDEAAAAKRREEDAAAAKARAQEDAERAREQAREASKRSKPSAIPWIATGIGVAGVATGFVFGGLAQSAHTSAVAAPDVRTAQSDQSTAQTYALVANVLFVAGGAVTLASVLWGIFDVRASARVRAAIGPSGFMLRGQF